MCAMQQSHVDSRLKITIKYLGKLGKLQYFLYVFNIGHLYNIDFATLYGLKSSKPQTK